MVTLSRCVSPTFVVGAPFLGVCVWGTGSFLLLYLGLCVCGVWSRGGWEWGVVDTVFVWNM